MTWPPPLPCLCVQVAQGILADPTNPFPAVCREGVAAGWTFIANTAVGSQFHEHVFAAIRAAYDAVGAARTSLNAASLSVFCLLVVAVLVCGLCVTRPSLYAVERLQRRLLHRLMDVPPLVRHTLAVRVSPGSKPSLPVRAF